MGVAFAGRFALFNSCLKNCAFRASISAAAQTKAKSVIGRVFGVVLILSGLLFYRKNF